VAAYGTFAVVAAIAGAIAHRADTSTDFRTNDWTGTGATALLISAVTLFIAFLFGGYIAGRMARRRGVAHGVAVFVVSIIVAAIAGGVVRAFTDNAEIRRNLRSIGVPTTWNQVSSVTVVGVIVALAAMLVGAILGGTLGDRWHAKLERRAADPAYGPDAETRREVAGRRDVDYDDRRDAGYRDDRRDVAYDDRRDVAYDDRRDAGYRDDREPVGPAGAGRTAGYDRTDGTDRGSFDSDRGSFDADRERSDRDVDEPGIGTTRRNAPVEGDDGTQVSPSAERDRRD